MHQNISKFLRFSKLYLFFLQHKWLMGYYQLCDLSLTSSCKTCYSCCHLSAESDNWFIQSLALHQHNMAHMISFLNVSRKHLNANFGPYLTSKQNDKVRQLKTNFLEFSFDKQLYFYRGEVRRKTDFVEYRKMSYNFLVSILKTFYIISLYYML
jgi:hypothetical protein